MNEPKVIAKQLGEVYLVEVGEGLGRVLDRVQGEYHHEAPIHRLLVQASWYPYDGDATVEALLEGLS